MTTTPETPADPRPKPSDFIRDIVAADLQSGKHTKVVTRFPPEPNGHLHIGHAKSICLNFGVARETGGQCNLRMDDTNPLAEKGDYADAIQKDVAWLGFDWGGTVLHASDYYGRLYEFAEELVRRGKAYVCDLNQDEIREYRGVPGQAGKNSPFRDRSVEENLDLFRRMRAGEFPDGAKVLRAKIDMASPNFNLRDPPLYRIRKAHHHRTGDAWCIYPMYDYAHALSDQLEGITHSLCTLEFEDHRPLYDWAIDSLDLVPHPRQIEFARLELDYTVMSKRKLKELVEKSHVRGWDDPRMPTIAGLRRRGVPAEAIVAFCERIGVAKSANSVEYSLLEHCIREDLDRRAARAMCVIDPIKVVIDNWSADSVEEISAANHPSDASMGTRTMPLTREIYIERADFMIDPPKKYFRLSPGKEVRLRYAYLIKCVDVVRDERGEIAELRCTYDPDTRGEPPDGRKVKGIVHWVSASHGVPVEVRLYDRLFTDAAPSSDGRDPLESLNPRALEIVPRAFAERSLGSAVPGARFQFERTGYFSADSEDSKPGAPVFNRTVTLRDSWAKVDHKG